MLDHNSLTPPAVPFSGLGDLYGRDTQQCLQKLVNYPINSILLLVNIISILHCTVSTGICVRWWEPLNQTCWWRRQPLWQWWNHKLRSGMKMDLTLFYLHISPPGQPWGLAWHQRRASEESEDRLPTLTGPWMRPLKWRRSALRSFLTAKYPGLTFSGYKTWYKCYTRFRQNHVRKWILVLSLFCKRSAIEPFVYCRCMYYFTNKIF